MKSARSVWLCTRSGAATRSSLWDTMGDSSSTSTPCFRSGTQPERSSDSQSLQAVSPCTSAVTAVAKCGRMRSSSDVQSEPLGFTEQIRFLQPKKPYDSWPPSRIPGLASCLEGENEART